jgi:hypothetical protein
LDGFRLARHRTAESPLQRLMAKLHIRAFFDRPSPMTTLSVGAGVEKSRPGMALLGRGAYQTPLRTKFQFPFWEVEAVCLQDANYLIHKLLRRVHFHMVENLSAINSNAMLTSSNSPRRERASISVCGAAPEKCSRSMC